jgi:hypothetical protein
MANLDTNQGYSQAKSKISAYQTVKQSKADEIKLSKEKTKSNTDKKKSDIQKNINELKKGKKDKITKTVNEVKSQLEELLELFKATLPSGGGSSLKMLTKIFLQAANNTKLRLQEALVSDIVDTIGCSEEQSYDSTTNQPIYIKVNQVDLFKILKNSPDDEDFKFQYEKNTTNNGNSPYSMNQQLYKRLQNPSQSFSQDSSSGNGQTYKGASQSNLFDIQYVQNYLGLNNIQVTGDFFKVTLNTQANNRTTVTDFLQDYYQSVDVLPFDNLAVNLKNLLTGSFDFSGGLSSDELREQSKFSMVLKRIMGICEDPNKKINVAGTAKLSETDEIDDSFFDVSNQELLVIENKINNTLNGVVEYDGCDGVLLPIDVLADKRSQEEIINENVDNNKIEKFEKSLEDLANDPKSKSAIPGFNLNILPTLQTDIILGLPKTILKTILSPKVMLGFLIMVKSTKNELSTKLDSSFDDLTNFMKTFKKFILSFMKKITSIFVEELFTILKKQIKALVESILLEIVKESKNKQISMYSSIAYILMTLGQSIVDFKNCKSVIDEILKLLNLGLSKLNLGLPQFILASSSLLGGVSDTRSFSNVIEKLQKQGLPTGSAPDGGPNLMSMAMMSMIKGMNQDNAENGKTEVFIPPLTVTPAGITLPTKGYGKSY